MFCPTVRSRLRGGTARFILRSTWSATALPRSVARVCQEARCAGGNQGGHRKKGKGLSHAAHEAGPDGRHQGSGWDRQRHGASVGARRWPVGWRSSGGVAPRPHPGRFEAGVPRLQVFRRAGRQRSERFQVLHGSSCEGGRAHHCVEIPKRSPCLNVCDYSLWPEMNCRMRAQEKRFAATKRETRNAYLKRLPRTALSLPLSVVAAAMGRHEASAREVDRCGRWQHRGGLASARPYASPSVTRSRLRFQRLRQNIRLFTMCLIW